MANGIFSRNHRKMITIAKNYSQKMPVEKIPPGKYSHLILTEKNHLILYFPKPVLP